MIDLRPLYFGLAGAARLVRLDISGMYLMAGGVRGFWASLFWSAGLVAPLYILLMLLRFDPEKYDGWRYLFTQVDSYVLAWLIFPFLMERISALINRRERYLQFIIAYNWLSCLYNIFYLLVGLAYAAHMLSLEAASAIGIGVMCAGLVWTAYLTRHSLSLPYSAAVGIVVLDLFISMMMSILKSGLLN